MENQDPKFPVWVYIKETYPDGKDFFWKILCITLDNEALGVIERLLSTSQLEYKVASP